MNKLFLFLFIFLNITNIFCNEVLTNVDESTIQASHTDVDIYSNENNKSIANLNLNDYYRVKKYRKRMIITSFILPGLPHFISGRIGKGIFLSSSFSMLISGIILSASLKERFYSNYMLVTDTMENYLELLRKYYDAFLTTRVVMLTLIVNLVALYIFNIIDTLFIIKHLKSIHIEFTGNRLYYGYEYCLRF